jgi:hypothetical protein
MIWIVSFGIFLNIVAVLYIFVFSWKLKRYLKLQNSNWIKFSNWPWCPVYWPWCPEKLSNIQGQTGLASIFPKFEACIYACWTVFASVGIVPIKSKGLRGSKRRNSPYIFSGSCLPTNESLFMQSTWCLSPLLIAHSSWNRKHRRYFEAACFSQLVFLYPRILRLTSWLHVSKPILACL